MNDSLLVISGTNREGSRTRQIADYYCDSARITGVNVKLLDLKELTSDLLHPDIYVEKPEKFISDFDDVVRSHSKFIFIMPEYNGGYAGILKYFIDMINPDSFYDKKAALVGVSSGYSGCARGMDAFGNVLNYLRVSVYYNKPKLSHIENSFDGNKLKDPRCKELIKRQIEGFLAF